MLLLLTVLLTACGSSGKEEEEIAIPEEDCYLDIYVYAPDRPIVTRAEVGEISSSELESKVNTLQIWVFKNSNGEKVGYLDADPQNLNNGIGQQKYRMIISNDFARYPENVDVYVVANAASCGLTSLGASTTRNDLNEAMIGTGYFGTTSLVSSVPANGLPMSAMLKKQPVSGKFPTLRIGTESQIATLQLTRAVSKLRFVLCRIKETDATKKSLVSIDTISLHANQIPTQTYFMPGTYNYSNYTDKAVTYVDENHKLLPTSIPEVSNPLVYVYETQSAQNYEDIIDAASDEDSSKKTENLTKLTELGITGLTVEDLPQLKELGLTYLRESDKQLKGTIKYTYREKENGIWVNKPSTATFLMAAPGDFLRNHSWIIYIYYLDSKIYTLTVTNIGMRRWTDLVEEDTKVYNW